MLAVAAIAAFLFSSRSIKADGHLTTPGHSVTLTWKSTPGAKYYNIYRTATSKSGYQKIGTSPTPSYKDAPVASGATFYYVVTAVGDKGESKFSSEIKAVVP